MSEPAQRGIQSAQFGILANTTLAVVKLIAGLLGNSYALVADAVESTVDIFSSLIVWGGLRLSLRDPNDQYPFGYGKAEPLAATVVALMLLGASVGIAAEAVGEILTPHHAPAPWTLAVLVVVVGVKALLSRRVGSVASAIGSTAVRADASHHMSDAFTSAAAFVGISIALWGGPGWEAADDWGALAASVIIFVNGYVILHPALGELMDRMPGPDVVGRRQAGRRRRVRRVRDREAGGAQERVDVSRHHSRAGRRHAVTARRARPRRQGEERDTRRDAAGAARPGAHGALRAGRRVAARVFRHRGCTRATAGTCVTRRSATLSHQRGCHSAATGTFSYAPSVPNETSKRVRSPVASVLISKAERTT